VIHVRFGNEDKETILTSAVFGTLSQKTSSFISPRLVWSVTDIFYAAFADFSLVLDLKSAWHRAEICLTSENENICAFKQATAVLAGCTNWMECPSGAPLRTKRQPHGLQDGLCVIPFCNALPSLSSPDEDLMCSRGTTLLMMCNDI
jgi:hypothetical protein